MEGGIETIKEYIKELWSYIQVIYDKLMNVKKEKIRATEGIVKKELQTKKGLAEIDETFKIPPEKLEEEPKKLVRELRKEFEKW